MSGCQRKTSHSQSFSDTTKWFMNPWKHDNLGLLIRFGIEPNSHIKRNTRKGQNHIKKHRDSVVAGLLLFCHLHCPRSFQVRAYSLSPRRPHVGPCRGHGAWTGTWPDCPGKPVTGRTWGSHGAGIRDTPSKRRTVRKLERVSRVL